jgi:hypothetical protein
MKCGLAEYGNAGVQAVLKELLQLHDRAGVLKLKQAQAITREEKRAALQYLMFLKKNGTG